MGTNEQVFRPFILILGFVILTGFLLMSFAHMFTASSSLDKPKDVGSFYGLWEVTRFNPTDGFEVHNWTIQNHHVYPTEATYIFTDPATSDLKYVQIIRNNKDYDPGSTDWWKMYNDYIAIERNTGTPGEWDSDWNGAVIPYQKIVDNYDTEANLSIVNFDLSGSNNSLIIHTMDNSTVRIWWNNYTMYLGESALQNQRISFWSAVRMVMFAEIPNCNPVVNYMVAAFVDLSLIMIVFVLVRSILPW